MDKYIKRDELVEWLKRIPLKDLSDGLGLCRVIMEEDFKKAIRTIPDGAIVDLEPVVHGRWIHKGNSQVWECSRCGRGVNANPEGIDLYCYHCGAQMDETVEENKE